MSNNVSRAEFEIGGHKIWLYWDQIVDVYECLEGVLVQGDYFDNDTTDGFRDELDEELVEEVDEGHKVDYDAGRREIEMYDAIRETVVDDRTDEEREMIGKIENVCGGMSAKFQRTLEGED
ncbi:MAG: hypothetical protein GY861_10795 [bacterium]|nr:hypothetical protein [bacterium]